MKKFLNKIKWWLNHPWDIPVAIDLWLIAPCPIPKWRRALSCYAIRPLTRIAVRRWHPETLESPPGWSPKPWNKRDWDLHSS